jgi:hypothetical protein
LGGERWAAAFESFRSDLNNALADGDGRASDRPSDRAMVSRSLNSPF